MKITISAEADTSRRNGHWSSLENVNNVNFERAIDIVVQSGYSSDAH